MSKVFLFSRSQVISLYVIDKLVRIAVVTDTFRPDINGVAMTLGHFVDILRTKGHLVYIVHTAGEKGKGGSKTPSLPLPGYPEVRIGLPSTKKLTQKWIQKRPDVIYVATESPLGYSAIKAAKKLSIPVASGFHTNFHHYMQKYGLGKMRNAALQYLKKVHESAHCTIVPSLTVKEQLASEGFNNLKIVGRGVNTQLFSPQKRCETLRASWNASPMTPIILMVGRVAAEKNLPFSLELCSKLRNKEPQLQAVVVGSGPIAEKLKNIYPWVHFVGMQKEESLAKHYASADILLFASQTETFGNVLLEGMASGLITISYDYAASSLHVTHQKNGLKAPLGNAECFEQCAYEALDLNKWERLRKNARETVLDHSWEKITDTFEQHLLDTIHMEQDAKITRPRKRLAPRSVETLILSDIHLGTNDSKAREVVSLLKSIECKKLILNGDIIDAWALRRGKKWRSLHTRVIRTLLKKMEKEKCEIFYLRGNHDDFIERFLPISLGRLHCLKEYIHTTRENKRYLVIHGDGFDVVSTKHKWLSVLGSVGYDILLAFNRFYNRYRRLRGKEYYSVSKAIKAKVKSAVNFVSNYEEKLVELAKKRNCNGIICGHIHTPADEVKDGIHYLNSGDWVETLSYLTEDQQGHFSLHYYDEN